MAGSGSRSAHGRRRRPIVGLVLFGAIAAVLSVTVGLQAVSATAVPVLTPPNLQILVPTSDISIGSNPDTGDRQLQFTHITWDAGAGPFLITPKVNRATGTSSFTQTIYQSTVPGSWRPAYRVPLVDPGVFIPPSDYRYPLTRFTLDAANQDGSPGAVVATSPKVDYCITADTYVGGVPHTPGRTLPVQSNCTRSSASLGFSVGWGDQYDQTDDGQPIDLTNVPDGTYVLRATVDPHHIFTESDRSDDVVDTTLQITGTSVTVLGQSTPVVTPPSVAVTSPAAGASISGTVQLEATASAVAPATIASVQYLLDGEPLGSPVTTAPFALSWDTVTTTLGAHTLSAEATDSDGTVATAAAETVTVTPTACDGLCVDGSASRNGRTTVADIVSTTSAGDTLVAFVSADGPAAAPQSATVSSAGLSWHLVQRSDAQAGDAEIWTASAPGVLTGARVTAQLSAPGYDEKLSVFAFKGAAGVGTSAAASAASGGPVLTLASSATGSAMLAAGFDWDSAAGRSTGADQTVVAQWVDAANGDTMWLQGRVSPSAAAGEPSVLDDSSPTADRWDLAGVEIVPAPPAPAAPVVHLTNPAPSQTVSGSITLAASVAGTAPIRSVQFLVDDQPVGTPVTRPPYVLRWNSASALPGAHAVSAVATAVSGATGHSEAVHATASNPAPPMTCFVLQASTQAQGNGNVRVAGVHTASSHEALFAFVSAQASHSSHRVTGAAVSGGGLRWHLVRRSHQGPADVEIWTATGGADPGVVRVRSAAPAWVHQHVTVIAIEGVDGPGSSAAGAGASATAEATLAMRGHTSLVFAVGEHAGTAPVSFGRGWVPLAVARSGGTTTWVQYTNDPTGAPGTSVSADASSTSTAPWTLAAVELLNDGA
jgi:hypothetical protein